MAAGGSFQDIHKRVFLELRSADNGPISQDRVYRQYRVRTFWDFLEVQVGSMMNGGNSDMS